LVEKYRKIAAEQGAADLAKWFRAHANSPAADVGVKGVAWGAVLAFLAELEADNAAVEGLGAMNRWPARTSVPIRRYLQLWERSCSEIGASDRLPKRLTARLFGP
jgi:hypothetical protein